MKLPLLFGLINQNLSNELATIVQKEFLRNGFHTGKIEIYAKGKMFRKQENMSDQKCRRVEIRY